MSAVSWRSALASGEKTLAFVSKALWIFFLVSLPVTSFPYFPPAIGGGALVRPLGLYPLLLLIPLVTLPRLVTRPLPRAVLALVPFVLVALASSLLSFTRSVDPALGITVNERVLRGLITLGVGLAIYLTVALYPSGLADLRASLRWLYTGFAAALLWGSLQAVYVVRFDQQWFKLMDELQGYVSIRKLFTTRVSGPTYEPNWFAEGISFLLLPWLLASVLSGYTVFRWRWRWLTIELLLLGWAVALLPFTFSRAGVLNLVVLAALSILFFRFGSGQKATTRISISKGLPRRLAEVGLVLAVLAGLVYAAGTRNEFFARIWGYWNRSNRTLSGYFEYLGFGARFIYGETAFRTFEEYPALGVGLGNYAFYFDEMLPDRPLAQTPEVRRLVTPEADRNRLITAKNLYLRLLAETGLAGTAAFIAFVVAILGCALFLWFSPQAEEKFWGTASLLGLIAFLFAALSFDSLAIPNMWVVFGLITAAAWHFSRHPAEVPAEEAAAAVPASSGSLATPGREPEWQPGRPSLKP